MGFASTSLRRVKDAFRRRRKCFADERICGNRLFQLAREYPSIINNGYRHIELACATLARHGLESGYTIVDVGAASGIVASMFAKTFPGNRIHAFEPVRSSYEELVSGTRCFSNVIPHRAAVGRVTGDHTMNISTRVTASSLFETSRSIEDPYFAENLHTDAAERVVVTTLDHAIDQRDRVALLKMDVQGSELEVLRGAEETLKRTQFVLTEVMNHDYYVNAPQYFDLDEFLRHKGFRLVDIIPSIRRDDRLVEWDVIYHNGGVKGR